MNFVIKCIVWSAAARVLSRLLSLTPAEPKHRQACARIVVAFQFVECFMASIFSERIKKREDMDGR